MLSTQYTPPEGVQESITEVLTQRMLKAVKKQARNQLIYPREVICACISIIAQMVVSSEIGQSATSADKLRLLSGSLGRELGNDIELLWLFSYAERSE